MLAGIVISSKALQPAKVFPKRFVTFSEIFMFFRFKQVLNADPPTSVTLAGILNVSIAQYMKALTPIFVSCYGSANVIFRK